jgi:hypothetical protein
VLYERVVRRQAAPEAGVKPGALGSEKVHDLIGV